MTHAERRPTRAGLWLALLLATALAVLGVAVRPPIPRDETRYLAVALEMWNRHDFLVPHLNGGTYSHKPPMLFWLMHAGWKVFGISEWSARMVGPLCGLGCVALTWRLARLLWPQRSGEGLYSAAVLMLTTSSGWMIFSSLTMFDAPLTLCVLAALIGVFQAGRGHAAAGWVIAGLAMGIGLLTKGPVVFVHTLPVMVLAPWWSDVNRSTAGHRRRWGAWYAGVVAAVGAGTCIALAWALPAAKAGGAKFSDEILWGQSAGRMVQSFRHARPIWFYLPLVPALLFPWSLWPPSWRALGRLGGVWHDSGVRFVLAWVVPAFAVFMLVSGKQAHYLLPLLPGAAILLARLIADPDHTIEKHDDQRLPAFILLGTAVGVAGFPVVMNGVPGWAAAIEAPPWALDHHPVATMVIVLAAGVLLGWDARGVKRRVPLLACVAVLVFGVGQWDVMRSVRPVVDVAPMGIALRPVEDAGRPIAHLGEYHGQYHFGGRLRKPFDLIWDTRAATWAREHPDGVIVGAYDTWPLAGAGDPVAMCPSGSHMIVAWTSEQILNGEAVLNQRGSRTRTLLPTGESPGGGTGPNAGPSADTE